MEKKQDSGYPRLDGWLNAMTGLGIRGFDKRLNTEIAVPEILDRQQLLSIYRGEGIGRKIVTKPAGDMLREWFEVEGDSSNDLLRYIKKLRPKRNFGEALIWSRLFGGSVVLMGINDGQPMDMPVNMDNILSITHLDVYERQDVQWTNMDLYNEPNMPMYGEPEYYHLTNQTVGGSFTVHESRLLKFDGELLPTIERNANQGWGDSVLQAVYTRLRGLCDGLAGSENLLTDFVIGVLKVPNLQQLLSVPEGTGQIRTRMQALDMVKHIMNTLVMDKNEEYERHSATATTGLESLLSLSIDILCAAAEIPRVILIGDQAKGLGGEAAGNMRSYYDDISSKQEEELLPQVERLIQYAQLAKDGPTGGQEIEDWSIRFKPLWQPTEKEDEEMREKVAKRDEAYVAMGLPPEIVLNSRFGGDSYSREMVLPEEYKEQLQEIINSGGWLNESDGNMAAGNDDVEEDDNDDIE